MYLLYLVELLLLLGSVIFLITYYNTQKPYFLFISLLFVMILLIIYTTDTLYNKSRRKKLRTMCIDTCHCMNRENIQYWVDYGTLLGIIREGDIIEYDNDCDFCIPPQEDITEKMVRLTNRLRDIDPSYYLEYHPWGAFRIRKDSSVFIDLYLMSDIENKWTDPTGTIDKDLIGSTKIISWKGVEIKIPKEPEKVLESRYGKNWKIPKRE